MGGGERTVMGGGTNRKDPASDANSYFWGIQLSKTALKFKNFLRKRISTKLAKMRIVVKFQFSSKEGGQRLTACSQIKN